jgi:hypothetical protein
LEVGGDAEAVPQRLKQPAQLLVEPGHDVPLVGIKAV